MYHTVGILSLSKGRRILLETRVTSTLRRIAQN
jgi:hypothetical protein